MKSFFQRQKSGASPLAMMPSRGKSMAVASVQMLLLVLTNSFLPVVLGSSSSGAQTATGRELLVGGWKWTHAGFDYTHWMENTPLHVGDVIVFKFTLDKHTVYFMKNLTQWRKCDHRDGYKYGHDHESPRGIHVEVTEQPKYIVCARRKWHCWLGQKVIIQAWNGTRFPGYDDENYQQPALLHSTTQDSSAAPSQQLLLWYFTVLFALGTLFSLI